MVMGGHSTLGDEHMIQFTKKKEKDFLKIMIWKSILWNLKKEIKKLAIQNSLYGVKTYKTW